MLEKRPYVRFFFEYFRPLREDAGMYFENVDSNADDTLCDQKTKKCERERVCFPCFPPRKIKPLVCTYDQKKTHTHTHTHNERVVKEL